MPDAEPKHEIDTLPDATLGVRIPSATAENATGGVRPVTTADELRGGVRGEPPLTARLEPWMTTLLADPEACAGLVAEHGSPVNVLDPRPLLRNASELVDAAEPLGVDVRIYLARKANKALELVEVALAAGHGVDVASLAELRQVLELGALPERVLLTAAVKPDALVAEAVSSGVIVSLDSVAELHRIAGAARAAGVEAPVMPRVAVPPEAGLRPTRFGEPPRRWVAEIAVWPEGVRVVGVHAHLDGYGAADRRSALAACLEVADAFAALGRPVEFVDLGGGVPMSYLDDAGQWRAFWDAVADGPGPDELLWRDRTLTKVYPYHQTPVRGGWLTDVLTGVLPNGDTAAEALARRGLRLHLEPGRSLLDGCGLTLARVSFVKDRSDGVRLVGLEMNRTQCRSTSDDFLVDPVLVPVPEADESAVPVRAFLVGAYCIEDEVLLLRRMVFPRGVAVGDLIAFVNTGGYLMHILESASHQIPLARNLVARQGRFVLDRIDGGACRRPRETAQ